MTMVSRRKLDKQLEVYIFELFVKNIVDLKNERDVSDFLQDVLSPTEKIMLTKRLAIALLLSKGYTYAVIDQILKVSSPTINKVSYFLNFGSSGYQKAVKKIVGDQKREALLDTIDEILLQLSRPGMVGTVRFEQRQKLGKELYKRKRLRNIL